MVDLNKISLSAAHHVGPVSLKAVKKESENQAARLFDEMVGQLGHHLLEQYQIAVNEEGCATLTLQLKGVDEVFAYDSCSSEALSAAFNADVAFGMLNTLFKEQNGELQMTSPSEIQHTKSEVAVRVSLSDYIHQGEFNFEKFKLDVLGSLKKKSDSLSTAFERYAPQVSLKGKYPQTFNLTLWFNDALCLFNSKHPDLLSLEGMLRRSMEGQR